MVMVMTVAYAALVSSSIGMMVYQGLAGIGFLRLPLSLLPPAIGVYASIHALISCLRDDLD